MYVMLLDEILLLWLVEYGKFVFGEEGFRCFFKMLDKGWLIYLFKNFLGVLLDGD